MENNFQIDMSRIEKLESKEYLTPEERFAERELQKETEGAMKETREGNLKTYSNVDKMMNEIL